MPGQRAITNFFSTVVSNASGETSAGSAAAPRRTRRGNAAPTAQAAAVSPTTAWIVNELQQAQAQIQQVLQGPLDSSAAAAQVFMHPRQSAFAEMLGDFGSNSYAGPVSPPSMLSPTAAPFSSPATRVPSLGEMELESPTSIAASDVFTGAMEDFVGNQGAADPSRLLRFDVGDISSFAIRNGATIQRITEGGSTIQLNGGIRVGPNGPGIRHVNPVTAAQQPLHTPPSSALRNKIVYQLSCTYCCTPVCERAMRAILLADTKVELYSTDIPPKTLRTQDEDRLTQGCNCRIRDTLCTGCGNVLGYHVSQPCDRCLEARNNGHFWMFYSEGVTASERKDSDGCSPLFWAALTPMCDFVPASAALRPGLASNSGYDSFCR